MDFLETYTYVRMILSNPNQQADNGHYLRTIISASIIQQTLYIVIFFSKLLHNKNITTRRA